MSETEEEWISDEDDKYKKSNRKIFSLSQFSQLMKKKIYTDEFDMSFDSNKFQKRFFNFSMVDDPISEDVESENNEVLSQSSSSTFSFHKRKMSLDLSKVKDKYEPTDQYSSYNLNKKYGLYVDDTILEEPMEEEGKKAGDYASLERFRKLKA